MLLLLASVAGADPIEAGGLELGRPQDSPAPRVVGGQDALPGRWPDAAALYTTNDTFGCTGVLVAPDVVLTAGHCGYGLDYAVLGTTDHRSGGETLAIAEAFVHDDLYTTFDVTALVLEEPIVTIKPRQLLRDCLVDDHLRTGAEVAIVGYGATDTWGTEWGTILQEALTTVTDADCADLSSGCNEAVSPGGELMAGGDGVDSCLGDSGGPLYLISDSGEFLVGLTSRAALPAQTPCGGGGIYVRADAIAEWVETVTGRILPRPDCDDTNRLPRPLAEAIEVPPEGVGLTKIDPNDANPDDRHTFSLVKPPDSGSVQLFGDGWVSWIGERSTSFVVRVTDQHGATGDVEIEVTVLPGEPGAGVEPKGGCHSTPAPAWLWAPGLLVLLGESCRRRRQSAC